MLVCFASVMHLMWGALILSTRGDVPIAATAVMVHLVPDHNLRALAYLAAGLLPAFLIRRPGGLGALLCVLPQQLLLITSGVSALVAVSAGRYADGVERPWEFIAMDQGIYLVLSVLYAFESVDRYKERTQ